MSHALSFAEKVASGSAMCGWMAVCTHFGRKSWIFKLALNHQRSKI